MTPYTRHAFHKLPPRTGLPLTKAEQAILQCLWEGKGLKETADALCVTTKTVEFHRTNLYRRMGIEGPALSHKLFDHTRTLAYPLLAFGIRPVSRPLHATPAKVGLQGHMAP